MPRSWMIALFALGLVPASLGCCPESCGDCAEAVAARSTGEAPEPGAGGIATLNGFVENRGQWPDEVLFFARRAGVEATVTREALVFRPAPALQSEGSAAPKPLVLRLPGDGASRRVEGLDPLPTRHSFFTGGRSASGALGYTRVALRDVQPGVDVVLRSEGGAFEYDLTLAPGASLNTFAVEVEGASRLELRDAQTMVLHTGAGEVEQRIRASWQGDERELVACRFRILDPAGNRQRFGFEAPERNDALALVVDPSLVYATYVGGVEKEILCDIAVDASGAVLLLAKSYGSSPTTPGSFQESEGGGHDGWVGRLSADGSTLEWGAFLGGANTEEVEDMAIDSDETIVVVGRTWSADFPSTPGSFQPVKLGPPATKSDVYISRIAPDGQSLVWSTFFGQVDHDDVFAVALYPNGDVLVSGSASVPGAPITPGAFDPVWANYKGMLYRLSASGSDLVFSTYYPAGFLAMVVDEGGEILAAGNGTVNAITTPGAFQETLPAGDLNSGYVARLGPNVSHVEWATYLGGSDSGEAPDTLSVDATGALYVQGDTSSADFPTTPGAFDKTYGDTIAGYVTKLLPEGTGLVWSTYISSDCCLGGGSTSDLVVDGAGNVTVSGNANESGWPTTPDALQLSYIGPFPSSDATLTKFDMLGSSLVYSSYLGNPTGHDGDVHVAGNPPGKTTVAFTTYGTGLPTTPGAYQPSWAGNQDLAVMAFDLPLLPWRVLGGGLKGTKDVPNLAGVGPLTAGSPTRLALRGASPSAPGWIVAGFSLLELPLLGGTLVPSPDVHAPILATAQGSLDLTFPWPALAPGTELTAQAWFFDPGAPQGWSASNALTMIGQ